MSAITTTVTWYVARNHLGQFNRGNNWVNDIGRARFHRKPSPVRAAITRWARENPDMPVPELLEWKCDISTATVMDETARTKSAVLGIQERKIARYMRDAQYRREMLEREIARKTEELKRLP